MKILNLIAIISLCPLLFYLAFESSLRKRLYRPSFVKVIRVLSLLAIIALPSYIFIEIIRSINLISNIIENGFKSNLWRTATNIGGWAFLYINIFWFGKAWWYFIKTDTQIIQSTWYVQKHFDKVQQKEYERAYEYLDKASQIKPDSVFVWSTMAVLKQLIFEEPNSANKHIKKAEEVLHSSEKATAEDKATFQTAVSQILFCRGKLKQALAHLKKAYELNPTPLRKEQYKKALKQVSEKEELAD